MANTYRIYWTEEKFGCDLVEAESIEDAYEQHGLGNVLEESLDEYNDNYEVTDCELETKCECYLSTCGACWNNKKEKKKL